MDARGRKLVTHREPGGNPIHRIPPQNFLCLILSRESASTLRQKKFSRLPMKFLHVMHRHPVPVQQRGGLNTQLHSHLPLWRNDDAGHAHPRHGTRYATCISVPSRRSGALRTNAHKHGALPQHMDLKSAARTYGTQNGKGKHYKKIENSEANTALPHKKSAPESCRKNDNNHGRKNGP